MGGYVERRGFGSYSSGRIERIGIDTLTVELREDAPSCVGLEVTRDKDAAAIGGSQMTDSGSRMLGSTAADAGTTPGPGLSLPPFEGRRDEPTGPTEAFDVYVEDLSKRVGSNLPFLFPRLEDQIRRRLGVAPLSAGAAALTGLVGVGIRLALALFATALVGEWSGIPWGRWAVILVFYGLFDAT